MVTCRVGDQALLARVAGRCGLARGDATWVRWAAGAQLWFDEGGARAAIPQEHATTMIA
jgi:hypothetical protein